MPPNGTSHYQPMNSERITKQHALRAEEKITPEKIVLPIKENEFAHEKAIKSDFYSYDTNNRTGTNRQNSWSTDSVTEESGYESRTRCPAKRPTQLPVIPHVTTDECK